MEILFLCTANISRSFMAERILKGKLHKINRNDIRVGSAGLNVTSFAPDPVAAELLRANRYDAEGHFPKQVDYAILRTSDLILCMENDHLLSINNTWPALKPKVRLLMSYFNDPAATGNDVGDCYGRAPYFYRLCFAQLDTCIEGLLRCI